MDDQKEKNISEIETNNAEQYKLKLEAQEIEKRLNQKWYKGKGLFQAVVVGVVAAGLLAAWGIGYLQPILLKNQQLAKIENEILKAENLKQARLNEETTIALEQEKEKFNQDLLSLIEEKKYLQKELKVSEKRAKNLLDRLNNLSSKYDLLSKQKQLSDSEKKKFEQLTREAEKEISIIKTDIENLKLSQKATEKRTVQLQRQSDTSRISGLRVRIHYNSVRKEDAKEIERRLSEAGALTDLDLISFLSFRKILRFKNRITCNIKTQLIAAQQIKILLEDIEEFTIESSGDSVREIITIWLDRSSQKTKVP